jgi:hypothetical protein
MPWNWSEIFPLAVVFHGSWRIQIEQCREHLRKHLFFDLEINPVCTSPYVQIREASHLKAAWPWQKLKPDADGHVSPELKSCLFRESKSFFELTPTVVEIGLQR